MHRRIPVHIVKAIGGVVTTEAIRASIDVRTGIIATSYVQYSNGFRTDLEELGAAKGKHSLVVNASQAAGAFEIDVKRMRIDALCATGHKWMLSGYGSGFVYISKELQERSKPRIIGWLRFRSRMAIERRGALRRDVSARAELGCPHFAGILALGASVEMMLGIGLREIEGRVLEINRYLTKRLAEEGLKVLSPLDVESHRSAETLVSSDEPSQSVSTLAAKKIFVTEKPQGFRVATDFFNDEDDIERLIEALG
jgi:selenocysteine lyase/cysteine desulfurase